MSPDRPSRSRLRSRQVAGRSSHRVSVAAAAANAAELSPAAIAVNSLGDLFVADAYANRMRMVRH